MLVGPHSFQPSMLPLMIVPTTHDGWQHSHELEFAPQVPSDLLSQTTMTLRLFWSDLFFCQHHLCSWRPAAVVRLGLIWTCPEYFLG